MIVLFSCFFRSHFMAFFKPILEFKYPRRDFCSGSTISFSMRSVHGFEAVVITSPPPPRLRVKGVRFDVIWKRALCFDRFWDGQ